MAVGKAVARAEEATDRVVSGLEAVAAMALVREVVVVVEVVVL